MNYYELLGIYPDASMDDIKKAYRSKANIHHPDKGGNAEIFKDIKKAYETLHDDVKRKQYNRQFDFSYDYKTYEKPYVDPYNQPEPTKFTTALKPQTLAEIRAMAANQYGKGINKEAANKAGFGKLFT